MGFNRTTSFGKKYINQSTRRKVVFGLMGAVALSVISFLFLPKTAKGFSGEAPTFVTTVKKAWHILITPNMLCMCIVLLYFGMQFTFGDAIYSPSIGFTLAFGDSVKELVPLCGMSRCVGALLGFLFSILLGECLTNRSFARKVLVVCALVGELTACAITFLILPDSSSLGNTEETSVLKPNVCLALLGALLFGFGDACLNTICYSFIGDSFRENSGVANALCNFVKDVFIAINFYSCSHLGLHTQVVVLSVVAVVGIVACFFVEHLSKCTQNNTCEQQPETCPKTSTLEKI